MASATADSSPIEANAAAAAAAETRGKRPVWNVPSNGEIEVGPVMGAVSWPALSESAKASPKSPSSDSLKSLSDGSASAPPGPLVSSPSAKPNNSAQNPNPVQNPMPPARQKSMKRGSGSSSSTPINGGIGPALKPPVLTGIAQTVPDKQTFLEPSPKGSKNGGGDQHRGYGGNRRGNNGGGSHHNHGNRRDQEWNHHRNANVHHQHQQQRGGIRSYPRPPPPLPVSPPFVGGSPLPLRPFVGNAVGFPDVPPPMYFVAPQPSPESLRAMPFVHPHAMFFSAMDPQRALLLKQIDYYFSSENLCKDVYLRHNMDDQGWVPISLIAGFNRVMKITNNMQYIVDTVRLSTLVEVKGEKIRRRNDWMNWLLLPSNHFGSTSGSQSQTTSNYESIAAHLHNVSLGGSTANHNNMRGPIRSDVILTRSASGNLNNQVDPSRDESSQFTGFISRSLSRSDTL